MFFEHTNFPRGLIEQTCLRVFSRRVYLFVEHTLLSHRTNKKIPRNSFLVLEPAHTNFLSLYFLIEQIFIFQETLSSPQTHYFRPESVELLFVVCLTNL